MSRGGVYVYRARTPLNVRGWRHFAYVGETTSFYHRHGQHMDSQPWADLKPRVVLRIPLPPWKWLLRTVEMALILLLWPAYNHKGNLWNPRRIPLSTARRQRRARDRHGWSLNFRLAHLLLIVAALLWLVIHVAGTR